MLRCILTGHKMVMKKTVTTIWFECCRCGEHGWVGPRISADLASRFRPTRRTP